MLNLPPPATLWMLPDVRSIVGADQSCVYIRQEGDRCLAVSAETGAVMAEPGEMLGSTPRYWIAWDDTGGVQLISRDTPAVVSLTIPPGRALQAATVIGQHAVITSWDGSSQDYPSGSGFGLEIFAQDGRHLRHLALAEPTFSLIPATAQRVACDHELIDVPSGQRVATCEDPGGLSAVRLHRGRLELWGEASVLWADPTSGRTIGGFRLPFDTWESPVFGGDHAFLAHDTALLSALNVAPNVAPNAHGQTVWTTATTEGVELLEFGGGCIWTLDSHGELTGFEAQTGEPVHKIQEVDDIIGAESVLAALRKNTLIGLRSDAV